MKLRKSMKLVHKIRKLRKGKISKGKLVHNETKKIHEYNLNLSIENKEE